MVSLKIYISDDCWSCQETYRIIADISPQFPDVSIEVIDIANDRPSNVFAVPTYIIDSRVVFLGNPTRAELGHKLSALQIGSKS